MSSEDKQAIFTEIFKEFDGHKISFAGRNQMSHEETKNLIYGEFQFSSFKEIFDDTEILEEIKNAKNFYDLGSGTGMAVVAAAMLIKNLEKSIGVELVKTLFDAAIQAKNKLTNIDKIAADKIEFFNQNFFDVDLSSKQLSPDIVFLHFPMVGDGSEELYLRLEEKFRQELKPGAIILSFIRKLRDEETFPEFKPSKKFATGYGGATLYCHKKI